MNIVERNQNENKKIYEAVKQINKIRPKTPLVVSSKDGQTTDEQEQSRIVSNYFKNIFHKGAELMPGLQPIPMATPFTAVEVKKAVSKLKDKKSPGCDDISVELIM